MFIFKIGSDEVRVRTDEEFKSLNDDEKISYVWNDLWPDDLGMTWLEKVLYDHDRKNIFHCCSAIWEPYIHQRLSNLSRGIIVFYSDHLIQEKLVYLTFFS